MADKKLRNTHPKQEVEEALQYAESKGWRVEAPRAHWGIMYCPQNDKDCRCGQFCITSISGTPRNAGTHAKQIRKVVDNCINTPDEREENENE